MHTIIIPTSTDVLLNYNEFREVLALLRFRQLNRIQSKSLLFLLLEILVGGYE